MSGNEMGKRVTKEREKWVGKIGKRGKEEKRREERTE
jgi:hypothetical protein